MTQAAEPHFDPHSSDLGPDSAYELYAELRGTCPVSRGENHGGYWSLARYADVRAAAMDHRTYCSEGGIYIPPVSDDKFPPIEFDPPQHTHFRKLIAPLTSTAVARRMEPEIRATAHRMVDGFIADGHTDLVETIGVPLPLHVITQLYRLDPAQQDDIREYSIEFLEHASDGGGRAVLDRVTAYWTRMFDERRQDPRDDFITELVQMNFEAPVSDELLANMMFILTYAGHDSTALGLGNTLLYLAEHPEVQDKLIAEPALLTSTIEEILRHSTPLHWFPRWLTRDVTLCGRDMSAGDAVILLYGSANRDPEEFPNPDDVVIDRKPNRHLAFGAGIHTCPGMALAKAEIRIAVEVVLERIPGFRVAGAVARTDPLEGGGRHLGVRTLPVTWDS